MSLSFSSKTAENDANVANQPLITQPAESDEDDIGCQYVREVPPQQIVDKLKKNSPAKSEQKSSDEDENLRGKQNFNMMPLATQASPMSVQTEGTEQEQDVRMAYNNPSEGTQCRELPVQLFQDQDDPERGDAMFKAKIPNFNILAMDDSDSESDSSESEESNNGQYNDADDSEGDDENTNLLSLLARREANKKRHEAFAIQLGLMAGSPKKKEIDSPSPHQSPKQSTTPNPQNTSHSQPLRGMLFSTPYNSNHYRKLSDAAAKEIQQGKDEIAVLRELEERYPHRDNQIRQLWSLLSPALSPQASSRIKLGNAPPPIFVTGPTGGGKTCIVRDVVTHLQETRPSNTEYRVGAAYINCATLEGGIDEIVHSAYRQLALNMKTRWSSLDPSSYRGRKRKRTKRSKSPKRMGAIAKLEEELTNIHCVETSGSENKAKSKTTVVTRGGSDLDSQEMEKVSGNGKGPDKTSKDSSTKDKEMDCQREVAQVRRSRRLKETEDNDNDAFDAGNGAASNAGEVVKETNLDLNATKEAAVKEGDLTASSSPASTTSQVAVATFGQELQQSLFQHPNDCAFLVVDQAERLLSLSSSTAGMSCPKSNFLAQLLLLPSMKGLNLTIIVITKSILLEHSRFNNLVNPERSLSTLSSAIEPMKVHFQAYKGKDVFKRILLQPMLLERIVGPEIRRAYIFTELEEDFSFTRQIVKSFLNTLVQTLYGSIRDLKEFVRVGRSLWPRYVQPLQSDNIEKTLLALQKRASSTTGIASSQPLDVPAAVGAKQILPFLDQQILPHIRANLTYGLYSLSEQEHQQVKPGGSLTATAYLVKCLMIAAFICQHNKADKDKQLFTIQKNGKRSHSNKKQQSHGEDLAFGNARNGVSKSFKLRLFPMERMLSVFVSIVGLNEDRMPGKAGQLLRVNELKPNKIGSSDLLDSLAHLRDMGMLHEKSSSSGGISTEEANLSAPKYWCSLTREEAEEVAKSVNFPLESYLY